MFQPGEKIICIKNVEDPLYNNQIILYCGKIYTVEQHTKNGVSIYEMTYYWFSPKYFISLLEFRKQKLLKLKENILK